MAESRLFSEGVDRVLQAIEPHGAPRTCFPRKLQPTERRLKPGETRHDWFVRLIDNYCDSKPELIALEEGIGIFACIEWRDRMRIHKANVDTIVVRGSLDNYYLNPSTPAFYGRLDFDYGTLGDPFSHPLPHIHVDGRLSPRFSLDGGMSGNVIVDYLEFLYRNFAWKNWWSWVERVWRSLPAAARDSDTELLTRVREAFISSNFDYLREVRDDLDRVKHALRQRKDSAWRFTMDGSDREILEYPRARER